MLICLSIDHRGAPLPLLERIERNGRAVTRAFADPAAADGSVVLATCNRFEVYLDSPAESHDAILDRLAAASAVPRDQIVAATEVLADDRAAEHLFAVAGGLESAVLGEGEIAGQVRRAHTRARESGTLTHRLERLFQTAARTSRAIKHRTGIQSTGRSLVRLALVLAESRVASWADARVLLIGTGAYAGATVAALRARGAAPARGGSDGRRGAGSIRVHSPSGRAAEFAASRGLEAVAPGELDAALADAELVIACSSVEDPLLSVEDLRAAPSADGGPRLLIDLGMPRNIDPAVAGLPGVELLDLETIAKHAPVPELRAEAEALDIVREAAAEFAASQAEREAVPALVALRSRVLGILEEELCRARPGRGAGDAPGAGAESGAATEPGAGTDAGARAGAGGPAGRGPHGGDDSTSPERGSHDLEAALRRFAGRLLHEPTTRIRALGREGRASEAERAVDALFGIGH
ncbi:glutamyl-tRNA reductase [Leucobacter chromiisoli]|uniref:glutamyl-tRNA reductase n=1 Tax=Leucobacter chromiisoli TaxID=2796471 RepID=UPI001F16EE24|nr:glutamyl-tRNA reductase [Leucobacter chromiisoli]